MSYRNYVFAMLPALLLFLTVELGLRIREYFTLGTFGVRPYYLREYSIDYRKIYRGHPYLVCELKPGSELVAPLAPAHLNRDLPYNEVQVSINSYGFRGRELRKGPSRIVCMGGSTTFDTMVSQDSKAWPAQLERNLQNLRKKYEVINAGVPGYDSVQNSIMYHQKVVPVGPSLLILRTGLNESSENIDPGTYGKARTDQSRRCNWDPSYRAPLWWANKVLGHSLLYAKSYNRILTWYEQRPEVTQEPEASRILDKRRRLYLRSVGSIVVPAQKDSTQVVLATQTIPEWKSHQARTNRWMEEASRTYGVPLIDDREFEYLPEHFADGMHFTDSGAKFYAESIVDRVINIIQSRAP